MSFASSAMLSGGCQATLFWSSPSGRPADTCDVAHQHGTGHRESGQGAAPHVNHRRAESNRLPVPGSGKSLSQSDWRSLCCSKKFSIKQCGTVHVDTNLSWTTITLPADLQHDLLRSSTQTRLGRMALPCPFCPSRCSYLLLHL